MRYDANGIDIFEATNWLSSVNVPCQIMTIYNVVK